ncbi:MAG: hypothetical protein MZW92_57645 [Comamonadaceae bacterium]|nr:hypothetical protein [Comamonadaceae bacterium]
MALHGGFIPYGGTFLTFSDYSRNAHPHGRADEAARDPRLHARLASAWARTGRRTSAVEHVPALRLIPNLDVWRPADARRDRGGLGAARCERRDGPSALALSRQNLPRGRATPSTARGIARGGYVLRRRARGAARGAHRPPAPRCGLALQAQTLLAAEGMRGARGLDALHDASSTARTRPSATRCCRRRCRRVAVEAGAPGLLAQVRRPRAARWSASPASANRRRRRRCTAHFGITAERRRRGRARVLRSADRARLSSGTAMLRALSVRPRRHARRHRAGDRRWR